jgi:hypothetical protein
MSSEELRLDLESFINKGLDQGLRGWPVKRQERDAVRNPSRHSGYMPLELVSLLPKGWNGQTSKTLGTDKRILSLK